MPTLRLVSIPRDSALNLRPFYHKDHDLAPILTNAILTNADVRLRNSEVSPDAPSCPTLLETLTEQLRSISQEYSRDMMGIAHAHMDTANSHSIRHDQPFGKARFLGTDERTRTRLGADDKLVEWRAVDTRPTGPFGMPVDRIVIPAHVCRGMPIDVEPVVEQVDETSFRFSLGSVAFLYDPLGLQKERPSRV